MVLKYLSHARNPEYQGKKRSLWKQLRPQPNRNRGGERRRPRVEEIQDLNLYEQAEKDSTIAHIWEARLGPYRDLVVTGGATTPDYPEGPKRSKARGHPARSVRVSGQSTNAPDQRRSW